MKSPTYLQQFHKITRAYFDDSLKPLNPCACFIGNLCNNNGFWGLDRVMNLLSKQYEPRFDNSFEPIFLFYTMEEICLMENNFLDKCYDLLGNRTEESLYKAMDTTLDILREIHESKGEVIDQPRVFNKRQLLVA